MLDNHYILFQLAADLFWNLSHYQGQADQSVIACIVSPPPLLNMEIIFSHLQYYEFSMVIKKGFEISSADSFSILGYSSVHPADLKSFKVPNCSHMTS